MRTVLALLIHTAPIAPFAFGHAALGAALALVVLALYIKDRKLDASAKALAARSREPFDAAVVKELSSLRAARDRWRYLQLPWLRSKEPA